MEIYEQPSKYAGSCQFCEGSSEFVIVVGNPGQAVVTFCPSCWDRLTIQLSEHGHVPGSSVWARLPLNSLRLWVALLRILVGLAILTTWYSNARRGFYTPDGLLNFFTNVFPQSDNPLTWYAAFITNVILPIRGFFSPFQFIGEFTMGVALTVGVFTPLASLAAAFFILNTFLATFGADWPWSYLTILGILGVCFFARAGRSLGLDALLIRRFGARRLPLW